MARFRDARLYILGEGEYRSDLEAMSREHRLQDYVKLVGRVPNEQLKFWYSAADLSCLVSSREGWANVLQESLACGTPVLATRVWGAPEVITSPELGLLVEQSVPAISEGLSCGLEHGWDRDAIAAHAAQRTWEVVAKEVDDFLTQVVSASPRQR